MFKEIIRGYLQQWSLNPLQVCHPKSLLATSDQRCPYGVLKDLVDTVVGENAGLVVADAEFPRHCARLVRHYQVALSRCPVSQKI